MSTGKTTKSLKQLRDAFRHVLYGLQYLLELFVTGVYRMMLERNTLQPLRDIIRPGQDIEVQRTLLRRWAQVKANECSYVQLAGGFLFTTVASCLQWPSAQNGHWCSFALFYASILVALIAVVLASQQMLVLPNRTLGDSHDTNTVAVISSSVLPQQPLPPVLPVLDVKNIEDRERRDLDAMICRLCTTHHAGKPNGLHVFALQAPMMLLTIAAFSFFAGVCTVVFAPLAEHFVWGDEAKARIFPHLKCDPMCTGLLLISHSLDCHIRGIYGPIPHGYFLSDLLADARPVQRASRQHIEVSVVLGIDQDMTVLPRVLHIEPSDIAQGTAQSCANEVDRCQYFVTTAEQYDLLRSKYRFNMVEYYELSLDCQLNGGEDRKTDVWTPPRMALPTVPIRSRGKEGEETLRHLWW